MLYLVLELIAIVLIVHQVAIPLFLGTPIFPFFREKSLESELREVKQQVKEKQIKDEVVNVKRELKGKK